MGLKSAYVSGVRGARQVAEKTGLLARLDRSTSRTGQYVRSLFAIYDGRDLATLGVPWWTYPAIDRVEAFLTGRGDRCRVLEFGAGASTLWLARRCKEVHSVEHDAEFADQLAPLLAEYPNVTVHKVAAIPAQGVPRAASQRRGYEHLDFTPYVAMADEIGGTFDLVVVDGRAREASLRAALPHLAEDGLVVFDNANRRRYRPGIDGSGLNVEYRRGMAPCLPYPSTTALLTRAKGR